MNNGVLGLPGQGVPKLYGRKGYVTWDSTPGVPYVNVVVDGEREEHVPIIGHQLTGPGDPVMLCRVGPELVALSLKAQSGAGLWDVPKTFGSSGSTVTQGGVGYADRLDYFSRLKAHPYYTAADMGGFTNGWGDLGGGYTGAGCYVDPFGWVHLRGVIGGGTSGTPAFTLPVHLWPQTQYRFPCISNDNIGYVDVTTAGAVNVIVGAGSNSYLSLCGMSFPLWQNEDAWEYWNFTGSAFVWPYPNDEDGHNGFFELPNGIVWASRGVVRASNAFDMVAQASTNPRHRPFRTKLWAAYGNNGGNLFKEIRYRGTIDNIFPAIASSGTVPTAHCVLGGKWFPTYEMERQFDMVDSVQNGGVGPAAENSGSGWYNLPNLSILVTWYGTPFGKLGYYKDKNNRVWLKGLLRFITTGTAVAYPGTLITTLPVGYRPVANEIFCCAGSGGSPTRFDVNSNGDVFWRVSPTKDYASLDGISFLAEV